MPKNNKKSTTKKIVDNKSYIRGLQLNGFRGYLNHTKIKFGKRLTLIFGKGSSGKSTILEAIKCLSASNINDVDLTGIKTKHILSKQNKSKSFQLGLSVGDDEVSRGIFKTFEATESSFYPSKVDLYSFSEKTKDGKLLEKNLFASIKNTKMPKELENSLGLKNLYLSKIFFAENEYAYKELFEHYPKYRNQLIAYLKKTIDFTDRMTAFYKKAAENSFHIRKNRKRIEEIKKKLEESDKNSNSVEVKKIKKEIEKLTNEINLVTSDVKKLESEKVALFEQAMESDAFSPTRYIFRSKNTINNHIKFLENKNISFNQFIKYLSNDLKIEKKYLYKNNRLRGREIRRSLNRTLTLEEQKLFADWTSLLEFLCYELSCMILGYDKIKNYSFAPSKNHFQWSLEEVGKTLNVKAMFDSCANLFSSVLGKIKITRHVEMQQMLANQFSQINLTNPHALIEDNQKKINKWLEIFEYDFKVSVERSGLSDETEIVFKKGGHKIPASQGGSGAQYLLTFLSACLGYKDDILLIEEPEKGLHPSLQVKLSKFFVENSETNQLLIETHSENLLLGVLKSIRDKELNPEDIVINYVYMENGESKVDELKVDSKGNFLSKWRHGFFTERLDLL
jgi:predicted ATPase